jgi:hypothetical protein
MIDDYLFRGVCLPIQVLLFLFSSRSFFAGGVSLRCTTMMDLFLLFSASFNRGGE